MKVLGVFFALSIGWMSVAEAKQANFKLQYVPPIRVQIFSSHKGMIQEEHFQCTPQTCCFSQKFYCFMDNGQCICPLHVCEEWPTTSDIKNHWLLISGTDAEKHCGRPGLLHKLTDLCVCDPDKDPPCDECNPPVKGPPATLPGNSLPQDCRPYN